MSRTPPQNSLETNNPRAAWRSWSSPLALGMLGSGMLWLAFPPVDAWPLAWVAPVPWLVFIRRKNLLEKAETEAKTKHPPVASPAKTRWRRVCNCCRNGFDVSRPYVAIWWASFAFWLAALHWLRYPHPLTHFGWLALSFYLAFYLPGFVAISRVAVHRLQVPLLLAAPIVWTGLELVRAHLLTGFLMAALSHTQYQWIELIQISDLGGAYAVSLLVMFVAACLARMLPTGEQRMATWPLLPLSLALLATLIYGYQRTSDPPRRAGPCVALIQGAIEASWKQDPNRSKRILTHYFDLSRKAVGSANRPVDLVVWPETMYRNALAVVGSDFAGTEKDRRNYEMHGLAVKSELATLAEILKAPLLLGIDAVEFSGNREKFHNSAVFVNRQGELVGRYDKMHCVMFGEYIPLADAIPGLYAMTPLTGGIAPGEEPQSIDIEGVRYSPNICYETVVPHVIRQQVRTAQAAGNEPDVLVNLTNDAWFRGSSELEMHLACGVFRAVECRKPLLIAANEGISASIDSDGRVVHQLPKRAAGYLLLTDIQLDDRNSVYMRYGDWLAGICLALTLITAVLGIVPWFRKRPSAAS